jgi:hypothetical protein
MLLGRALLPHLAAGLLVGTLVGGVVRAAPPQQAPTKAATAGPMQVPPQLGGPTPEGVEFFEAHIRPVLVEKCYGCHSSKAAKPKGGLRLDSRERIRAGGESGPAIVPNKPDESLLLSALRYESNEMPPTGKLPDSVINDFAKWIAMGAPDPRSDNAPVESQKKAKPNPRDHWAYKQPQRATPPKIVHQSAARSDIDRFIIARLESEKLSPSPQAQPRAILRRLYYDLIGLPPTAEQLDEFAADPSDAHYESTIDRLLASPRFGERWARYWLDVARYADTKGYLFEEDRSYKYAYTYRDWVINSFNVDRPYDKFIVAQIAAEQIDDKSAAPAIGFLTLGRRFLKDQHDIINDRIDVVSRGLLGLTVACARCHDHKFDPISAADYYALYGVFANSQEKESGELPPTFSDAPMLNDQVVFLRGNPGNPGPRVDRRFLEVLSSDNKPVAFKHGSGRRELAEAIASRTNPLTARVWVNRIWDHLFGHGIVDTPSDFGSRGTPPTHPELLDTLACQFMDEGWSTKKLIRQIVLSATYRQASDTRADCDAIDPDNRLLWRANRRRLDLEALRDSLLLVSGQLDEKMGGPSVSLTDPPMSNRRAVYGYIERQNLPAFFRTFDFANPNTHTADRPQTTAPQQALFLMNSPFAIDQSIHLATRSDGVAGLEPKANAQQNAAQVNALDNAANRIRRITRLFRCAFGREPTIDEVTDAVEFTDRGEPPESAAVINQLAWQFGWGSYDGPSKTVRFQSLSHFATNSWQGSPARPDPAIGWTMLTAEGGHPGDPAHCAVRRWTAPSAGRLYIDGVFGHSAAAGDGVRGRIVASRVGVVGQWEVARSQAATSLPPITVQKGDTIDFITDMRATIDHDVFRWPVTLRLTTSDKDAGQIWDSTTGFHGPITPPLTRWQQLAQVLLMSNEFAFVD